MADPDLAMGGGGWGEGHPDPEMRGEGRSGLRASFWSKNKVGGGGRAPRAPPLDPPLKLGEVITMLLIP